MELAILPVASQIGSSGGKISQDVGQSEGAFNAFSTRLSQLKQATMPKGKLEPSLMIPFSKMVLDSSTLEGLDLTNVLWDSTGNSFNSTDPIHSLNARDRTHGD